MTTKEFQRRCIEFSKLNSAAHLFENESLDCIFKLTLFQLDGQCEVHYTIDTIISRLLPDKYYGVWFDRFTRHDFMNELGYFKGFLSRLSKNQSNILKASLQNMNIDYLYNYLQVYENRKSDPSLF